MATFRTAHGGWPDTVHEVVASKYEGIEIWAYRLLVVVVIIGALSLFDII